MQSQIKKSKKKYWIGLILCIIGCYIMSGCNMQVETDEDTNTKKEVLNVWAWDDAFNVKAARMAAQLYQQENTQVEIHVVSREKDEVLQNLLNHLSAGVYEDLPDIVLIEDYQIQDILSEFSVEFVVLDDAIDYSLFQDYKAQLVSREGVHYGVPFDSGAAVMFYREDYIQQAGYTDEEMKNLTWEKYIEIGQRVKQVTGADMLTLQPDDLGMIRIMMQSAGSWYVSPDGKNADIRDSLPLREAILIYERLVEEEIALPVSGWEGFASAFQDGKVATVVSGCWIASTIQESEEQSGLWRVAPIPRMEGMDGAVNASNIGGSSWYVLKNRANAKEAVSFLKETFAENASFINTLVDKITLVSTRKDVQSLPACNKKNPFFGDTNVMKEFSSIARNVPVVNYGTNTYEIEALLAKEIQDILKGEGMEEGLQKVQVKAQEIIE